MDIDILGKGKGSKKAAPKARAESVKQAPQESRQVITYTLTKSYDLEECVKHLERCIDKWNLPRGYNYSLEGVPTGWKPTRLF